VIPERQSLELLQRQPGCRNGIPHPAFSEGQLRLQGTGGWNVHREGADRLLVNPSGRGQHGAGFVELRLRQSQPRLGAECLELHRVIRAMVPTQDLEPFQEQRRRFFRVPACDQQSGETDLRPGPFHGGAVLAGRQHISIESLGLLQLAAAAQDASQSGSRSDRQVIGG
jgi:hypothetical protein